MHLPFSDRAKERRKRAILFIFPTHQPDDFDLFSIEFKTHCKLRIEIFAMRIGDPSILNQITIGNWLIFSVLVYCCAAGWNLIIYFCSIFIFLQEISSRLYCLFVFAAFHLFFIYVFYFSFRLIMTEMERGLQKTSFHESLLDFNFRRNLFKIEKSEINDSTNRTIKKEILLHKLFFHKTFLYVLAFFCSQFCSHTRLHVSERKTPTRAAMMKKRRIPKKAKHKKYHKFFLWSSKKRWK